MDGPATYEDLLALPEDEKAEIIAGEIVVQPAGLPEHGRSQGWLWSRVGGAYDDDDGRGGPGGWWILQETDVRFRPNEIVRPDLAGWLRERLPSPWGLRPIDVVPDWTCEILSPSNRSLDLVTKRELYARHGVRHYWIVDPENATLEALELVDGGWCRVGHHGRDDCVRVPPFEEVELELSRLFLAAG